MSNEKGIKLSRATEQEYGHTYPIDQYPGYKYTNDDKRVEYHVTSDAENDSTTDVLYGVDPEGTVASPAQQPVNRIRARLNAQSIAQDHTDRAYRVNTTAPIFSKTDPGSESYALQNDPRTDEVNKIRSSSQEFDQTIAQERAMDIGNPLDRFSIGVDNSNQDDSTVVVVIEAKKKFKEGLSVKHVEEKIAGKIKFVGSDKIAVVWEDQTRERFSFAEASKYLTVEAYIDSTQDEVAPIDTTENDVNLTAEANSILDQALAALDDEDDFSDVEDANPNKPKFDIEKAKLQRKVNQLESQVNASNIEKIKKKAAQELVDLMQEKGMLSRTKEAAEEQINLIMAMDDNGYESFKNAVLGKKPEVDDVLAVLEDDDYSDIEDGHAYAQAREAIKKASDKSSARSVDGIMMGDTSAFENGGLANFRGVVGDFSSQGGLSATASSQSEPRSVKRRDSGVQTKEASNGGLDFSGFQNLEGFTKPINIPTKEVTAGSKFSDLFSGMNWTTISKVH